MYRNWNMLLKAEKQREVNLRILCSQKYQHLAMALWGKQSKNNWSFDCLVRKYKRLKDSPGQVAELVGASSHASKGCRFDSWSGHIPRLWVQSPVGAHRAQPVDISLSHWCFSLSPSLTFFLLSQYLSLHLSLKSINISMGEDLKKVAGYIM